jgi:putative restriction endonuclease
VRIVGHADQNTPYSPTTGYRYDGLFTVDDYWRETGRFGFRIWRYRLIKMTDGATYRESGSET